MTSLTTGRIRFNYVFLLLLWALFSPTQTWAAPVAAEQGLLWRIERPGVAPSHLFGTIHSGDPRVMALFQRVQEPYRAATSIVTEMEFNPATMMATAMAMLYTDGRQLKSVLDADLYKKVVAAAAREGLPAEMIERMKPWAVFTALSMPKDTGQPALDMVIASGAQQMGKPTYGLETAEEQMQVLEGLSQADQIAMLRETVRRLPEKEAVLADLFAAYLARDLARLKAIQQREDAKSADPALSRRLNAVVLDQRNVRMVERMETYLKRGAAFIAVGSLHLPGTGGLLERLRARGYQVTSVF